MDKPTLTQYLSEAVSRGRRSVHNELRMNDTAADLVRNLIGNGYEEIEDSDLRAAHLMTSTDFMSSADAMSSITLWSVRNGDAEGFYLQYSPGTETAIVIIVTPTNNRRFRVLRVYFSGPGHTKIYSSWYDKNGKFMYDDSGLMELSDFNRWVFVDSVDESVSRGKRNVNVEFEYLSNKKDFLDFLYACGIEFVVNPSSSGSTPFYLIDQYKDRGKKVFATGTDSMLQSGSIPFFVYCGSGDIVAEVCFDQKTWKLKYIGYILMGSSGRSFIPKDVIAGPRCDSSNINCKEDIQLVATTFQKYLDGKLKWGRGGGIYGS